MYDIQHSGRLALETICKEIYSHYYPPRLDYGPVKDLIIKHEIDPEHIIAVTLMYRASVDASTEIDSYDVMYWLRTEVNRYCQDKAAQEEAQDDEEEESS